MDLIEAFNLFLAIIIAVAICGVLAFLVALALMYVGLWAAILLTLLIIFGVCIGVVKTM
jgi:hypothetical protein